MPRKARQKTFKSVFHVMCRSISEVDLFKDNEDKKKYLFLIRKYQKLYGFKVYGYCLMDNHVHIIIDVNGADISKIMHGINFSYARYFNIRHKRHGHLFQDRFRSKIVANDRYLMALSAYIHNNPMDLTKYKSEPEKYPYSSLAVYLGLKQDVFGLISNDFVLQLFGKSLKQAREHYLNLVYTCNNEKLKTETEFENEETEYRSERKILVRDFKPEDIIEFIAEKLDIPKRKLNMKYCRGIVEAKALAVVLMRSLCNFRCKDICNVLGNMSQVRISELSTIGINLIEERESYHEILETFIQSYAT